MSWVTVIWSTAAGMSLAFAGLNLLVWSRDRAAAPNLLFGLAAVAAAVLAMLELVVIDGHARGIHALLDPIEDIQMIEDIHAHRFGSYLVINLTICVDGNISVTEGDAIASRVESILMRNIEFVRNVHVHYHPDEREL